MQAEDEPNDDPSLKKLQSNDPSLSRTDSSEKRTIVWSLVFLVVCVLPIIMYLIKILPNKHPKLPNHHFVDNPVTLIDETAIVDRTLATIVAKNNINLPMMVDRNTRLDNTASGGNKMLIYNYTLINATKIRNSIDEFKSEMRSRIINGVKSIESMSWFRDNRVSLLYIYKDISGKSIMEITITPEDYIQN